MSKLQLPAFILTILTFPILSLQGINLKIHQLIINSDTAIKPVIIQNTLVLSYASTDYIQSLSAAFAHENYSRLHTYERNAQGVFFLAFPLPENLDKLDYRIVVDGIWTTDPLAQQHKDHNGIMVSTLFLTSLPSGISPGARKLENRTIQFVFQGQPGSLVSLVGNFNKWDPYLTPMNESLIQPGLFTARLEIVDTPIYYRYVVDGLNTPDPANPHQVVNGWGEIVSVIK